MKLLPLLSFALLTVSSAWSQVATCDGSRYATIGFTPTAPITVQYGNNTTIGGNNQDLFLDFYEPSRDLATERPLIIVAFGGSFISGAREDMDWMCEYYASLGYATATIDYRLYDGPIIPLPDSVAMTEEVLMAVSDFKAAIRFFKEDAANANTYRIDTNYIFVGGISAGGIAAAHTALLDPTDALEPYIQPLLNNNGGWTGNSSTNTQHTDDVRGVLNFSGALRKASYIDVNDPAIFSVHDDGDGTVPYASGAASIFGFPIITMEGSFLMDSQAQNVGASSELITIQNSNGHVSYFQGSASETEAILSQSKDFLYDIVCPQFVGLAENNISSVELYPNPTQSQLTVAWNGENEVSSIEVRNAMGQQIQLVLPTAGTETTIDMTDFAAGMYFVRIATTHGIQTKSVQKL